VKNIHAAAADGQFHIKNIKMKDIVSNDHTLINALETKLKRMQT
jgi:hypothetical protein